VSVITFGMFEFDPDSGVLTRGSRPVRLQPQPARVLAILVAHAGDVVARDTLRQQVWADGTFVDFERGLNFCIAQIRSALGDSADSPRFIETLPRRGYRFIAPVGKRGAAEPVAATQPTHARPVNEPRARSGVWVSLAGLIVFALATAVLVSGAWRAGGLDRRVRLAVVPFDNETGMDDYDLIARGVADATVARLASAERIGRFSVIGNAAALHQPRAFRDLKRIGAELRADYIVLAQMKRDASQVRLIAHLIRIADEADVWANTYDAPAFTLPVQSQIAESIAVAVAKTLANPPSPRRRTS
jgi:DNA-binding winged helix-turn-helix (wHTH) protein/TolB-like protein